MGIPAQIAQMMFATSEGAPPPYSMVIVYVAEGVQCSLHPLGNGEPRVDRVPMEKKTSLIVLDGGGFERAPRAIAIDMGTSSLSEEERASLVRARALGLRVVAFASSEKDRGRGAGTAAPVEVSRDADAVFADDGVDAPDSPLSRRARRADALARWAQGNGMGLADVAMVATEPVDRDMLMASGIAFALEGAGYSAVAAADRVFPSREDGGLVQAVDAVCALLPHGL